VRFRRSESVGWVSRHKLKMTARVVKSRLTGLSQRGEIGLQTG
jgi:hypothetical protein